MIETAETVCPQCGALLTIPHQVETFPCAHCGSSLRAGDALRLHRLVEPPCISRAAAEGFLRSWVSGGDVPADLATEVRFEVGGLRYFPFLRVRRMGSDSVAPLASLPAPEVVSLARVPARLQAGRVESAPCTEADAGEALPEWTPVDARMLGERLNEAVGDAEATELLIEQRAYYPVRYSYKGGHYSAAIAAGTGSVLAHHRPAHPDVAVESRVVLGTMAVLFAEALLLPGLVWRIVAIGLTSIGLYPLLRRYVENHG